MGLNKKASLLFCFCLFPCLFTLTSCEKKEEQKTEITLIHGWGAMEEDHVSMRNIYEDFEKKNPDIKLNLVSMPSSEEVIGKANDMISVGKIPDIIFSGGIGKDSFYNFIVEKNHAVDFVPYIREDPEFAADLGPEIAKYWLTKEGSIYSISDVLLLSGGYWYNKDILREAGIKKLPKTWDEFIETCDTLKQWAKDENKDIIPLQMNEENSLYLTDSLVLYEEGVGAQSIMDQRITINQTEFLRVINNLRKIYRYSYVTNENYSYRDNLSMFNAGKSAMYINGVWSGQMISPDLDASYAILPSRDGQTVSCMSSCLGFVVGDTGDQDKIDASVRFVKYMVSDEVQRRILEETGQVPSNPAIDWTNYEETLPLLTQAVQEVKGADIKIEVPNNIWCNKQMKVFEQNIMDVMRREITDLHFIDMIK